MRLSAIAFVCMICTLAAFGGELGDTVTSLEPAAVSLASSDEEPAVVSKPLTISSGIEAGEVVAGQDEQYRTDLIKGGHWQSRLGVWLTQEVTVKKRLVFKMGVGGIFWYTFPEEPGMPDDYVTKFGPGIAQATGIYSIGDIENPLFQLQFGYFPFKYNTEATNLGEYLLRSSCYPGLLQGGNWNVVGDALYRVLGLRFSNFLLDKTIQNHLIVSMERDVPPMYDLSLTYIGDAKVLNKVVDIGVGIDFHHLISANEKKTTPHNKYNRYLDTVPLDGNRGIGMDSAGNTIDSLADVVKYYSFRGIKLMAKLCLDPKPLFPASILGPEDLKIFGEVAILGVQNFPYYYDDITKRMPVMFGFNMPCFKVLDVFSIQWEWYGSNFENSLYNPLWNQLPLPTSYPNDPTACLTDTTFAQQTLTSSPEYIKKYRTLGDFFSTDNWKWSIFLKRTFSKNFNLTLQMANDNLRLKVASGRPNYVPSTRGNQYWNQLFMNQWYFMLRLNYGM
jgi:hypothetical protein